MALLGPIIFFVAQNFILQTWWWRLNFQSNPLPKDRRTYNRPICKNYSFFFFLLTRRQKKRNFSGFENFWHSRNSKRNLYPLPVESWLFGNFKVLGIFLKFQHDYIISQFLKIEHSWIYHYWFDAFKITCVILLWAKIIANRESHGPVIPEQSPAENDSSQKSLFLFQKIKISYIKWL